MLFQTHYRLDPTKDFSPWLIDVAPFKVSDKKRRSSLTMCCAPDLRSGGEGAVDHALGLYFEKEVQNIPSFVREVLGEERRRSESSGICLGQVGCSDGLLSPGGGYWDFFNGLADEMDREATEVFSVLRWRLGLDGGPLSLRSLPTGMRFESDSVSPDIRKLRWPLIGRPVQAGVMELVMPETQVFRPTIDQISVVEDLIQMEAITPLHHDLLREAWENQREKPRSSLVLGIAALETAVKSTLVSLNESLGWFLENVPSPPIERILKRYLPMISARNTIEGKVLCPPPCLMRHVKSGVELRNKIVHGHDESVQTVFVRDVLLAVRDTSYLLDFYNGHEWALERIRLETLRHLGM
jgi:hypothetical protein